MKPANRVSASLLCSLLVCATLLAIPGDHATAGPPSSLATLLPNGAVTLLEVEDLRALIGRWNTAELRRNLAASQAAEEVARSRLYLRLARNLGEVEDLLGYGITLERLAQLGGHRSAIAFYDLATTSFVFVSELTAGELKAGDWFEQRRRMEERQHRGVAYGIKPSSQGKAALALAIVGERLIVGTDIEAFRGTLVLAARAAGLPVTIALPGQADPVPLGEGPDYRALLMLAPRRAPVHVWVSRDALASRYFDNYWLFGPGGGRGIRAAWLALEPGRPTRETRIYRYEDLRSSQAARPRVGRDDATEIGASDLTARLALLPPSTLYASAHPTHAADAAQAILELMPAPRPRDGVDPVERLRRVIEPWQVHRAIEVIDPEVETTAKWQEGRWTNEAAVALGLEAQQGFAAAQFEGALLDLLALQPVVGAEVGFVERDGLRVLELPLIEEWKLSWLRQGDALVVGTSPTACLRLAQAVAPPNGGRLLRSDAPLIYRLDLRRASAIWEANLEVLRDHPSWTDPRHADLFGRTVTGLFHLDRELHDVTAFGYARGERDYVEEVQVQ